MKHQPYTAHELCLLAITSEPIDVLRVLATYADIDNWRGIYGGEDANNVPQTGKNWASCGPVCPPWELAERCLTQQTDTHPLELECADLRRQLVESQAEAKRFLDKSHELSREATEWCAKFMESQAREADRCRAESSCLDGKPT